MRNTETGFVVLSHYSLFFFCTKSKIQRLRRKKLDIKYNGGGAENKKVSYIAIA